MKNILMAYAYLSIFLILASTSQIQIFSSLVFTPQIDQDYSIVYEFVYPSSSKFVQTLPKDYYVTKIKGMNISQVEQQIKVKESSIFISFEKYQTKEIPIVSKFNNVPPIQDYHAILTVQPSAVIPVIINEKIVKNDFANTLKNNQIQQANKDSASQAQKKINDIQIPSIPIKPSPNYQIVEDNRNNLQKQMPTQQLPPSALGIKRPPLYNSPNKQLQPKDQNSSSKQNNQLLNEIEQLRYKNHKWSIIIIILIIVVLLTFLFGRLFIKNKLQTLNKRLDHYRIASDIVNDEQQQTMTTKVLDQQQ